MCRDRWQPAADPELGAPVRAVVADAPGQPIALSLFGEDGAAVVAHLSPQRAITLAGRLLDAASRRLP
jgi:hypothetical protein